MKKILLMIFACLTLFTGCSKLEDDNTRKVIKYLNELNSYSLVSNMTINRADKRINVKVGVDYLAPNYYKVSFGNDDQIIIKNDSGVFVLNPSLNKEFRFDSQWPLNGSHAYLLEAINKDLAKGNVTETNENGVITLECNITHKSNKSISKMKYSCDKNYKPLKTVFLNDNGEEIIIVDFDTFIPNSDLGKDHFNENKYLSKDVKENDEETSLTVETAYVIEGSSLASSSIEKETSILCYSGEVNYTIVVNKAVVYAESAAIEDYKDFEILECGLCLFDESSMRYYLNGYEITIYSNELDFDDYLAIAESITLK